MTDSKEIKLGLNYLLELDGEIFPMDNGYWTKIEAQEVKSSDNIPHGIKYSLTLHDQNNRRIIGYDHAHGVKPNKEKFESRKIEWDHKHEKNRVKSYEFESAEQLLDDFWNSVNKIIDDS